MLKAILVVMLMSMFWGGMKGLAIEGSALAPSVSASIPAHGDRIVGSLPGAQTLGIAARDHLTTITEGNPHEVLAPPPPGQIVMADGNPPMLLAGEQDGCMSGQSGSALQRSDDGGQTWIVVSNNASLRPLALWPDGLAIASNCSGLHLSLDVGSSWTPVDGVVAGYDVTAFAVADPDEATGRSVLVGLTSEGGTTTLYAVDLSDPSSPMVSEGLRTYYAVGGLAGRGDTYVQVAMGGAWVSTDAGASWERASDGLEGVVLERDPIGFGLPEDFDPQAVGMSSVDLLPDGRRMIAGTADGLYLGSLETGRWTKIEGTQGRVEDAAISADGSLALYLVEGMVMQVAVPSA